MAFSFIEGSLRDFLSPPRVMGGIQEQSRRDKLAREFSHERMRTTPGYQGYANEAIRDPKLAQTVSTIADFSPIGAAKGVAEYIDKQRTGEDIAWYEHPLAAMDALSPVPLKKILSGGIDKLGITPATKYKRIQDKYAGRMSKEESERLGLWDRIGNNKRLKMPISEMDIRTTDVPGILPERMIDLDDFQGKTLVSGPGDVSQAGKILHGVNQYDFANPLLLEGGRGFMRTHSPYGSIWASADDKIKTLNKKAMSAIEAGSDPILAYAAMGPGSMSFNKMMTDAMYEMANSKGISKKAKSAFDKRMRAVRPEWKGIDHPDSKILLENNGAVRHAFNHTASLNEFQKMGFPDLTTARIAIADPELIRTPLHYGGQSFGRMTGETILTPKMPHGTYPAQAGGEYLGRLPDEVPREIMYPDFYRKRRAAGTDVAGDARSFELSKPTQFVDQEWIDTVGNYLGL